jgi:hypothetical protein
MSFSQKEQFGVSRSFPFAAFRIAQSLIGIVPTGLKGIYFPADGLIENLSKISKNTGIILKNKGYKILPESFPHNQCKY